MSKYSLRTNHNRSHSDKVSPQREYKRQSSIRRYNANISTLQTERYAESGIRPPLTTRVRRHINLTYVPKINIQMKELSDEVIELDTRLKSAMFDYKKTVKERDNIVAQINERQTIIADFNKRLNKHHGIIETVAKGIKQDIELLRTQNDTLKNEIYKQKKMKSRLHRGKENVENNGEKINQLEVRLQQTEFKLERIRANYNSDFRNLEVVKDAVSKLRDEEYFASNEIEELTKELNAINSYKRDLVDQINKTTSDYEASIMKMGFDKRSLQKEKYERRKQLSSVQMFSILKKQMLNRLGCSLSKIKKDSWFNSMIHNSIMNLKNAYKRCRNRIVSSGLMKWRSNTINYMNELRLNILLMDLIRKKKQKHKYFAIWRNSHHKEDNNISNSLFGARQCFKIILKRTQKKAKEAFCKWLKWYSLLNRKEYLLRKCIINKGNKYKRKAIHRIYEFTKESINSSQFQSLSDIMTNIKYKREVFMSFREQIFAKENRKTNKFQLLLNNNNSKRKKEFFIGAIKKVIKSKMKFERKSLIEEGYSCLKYNRVEERRSIILSDFNNADNRCQNFKEKIEFENNKQKEIETRFKLRAFFLIFTGGMKYCLKKWRDSIVARKIAKRTLTLFILKCQNGQMVDGFNTWRNYTLMEKQQKMKHAEDLKATEIQDLLATNIKLDHKAESNGTYYKKVIMIKLRRSINILKRKKMIRRLVQWKEISHHISEFQLRLNNLERIVYIRTMKDATAKYRRFVNTENRKLIIELKEKVIREILSIHLEKKVIYGLSANKYQRKYANYRLKRMLIHLLHDKESRYFNAWRRHWPNTVAETFKKQNNEKKKIINGFIRMIKQVKASQDNTKEDMNRLYKIEKRKAKMTLSKLASVKEYNDLKNAIFYWRKHISDQKSIKVLLPRYLTKLHRNKLRYAMSQWLHFTFSSRMEKMKTKLNRDSSDDKKTMRKLYARLSTIDNTLYDVKSAIQECNNLNESKGKQAKLALNMIYNLKQINRPIHRDMQCFMAWNSMYDREKRLQRQIKACMKESIGKFIYQKVRWQSLQNNAENVTRKLIAKLLKIISKMYRRRFLNIWKRDVCIMRKSKTYITYENCDEELIKHTEIITRIKNFTFNNYIDELLRRKKKKVFCCFRKEIMIRKMISERKKRFKKRLRFLKLDKSMLHWRNDAVFIDTVTDKRTKSIFYHSRKIKKGVLRRLKQYRILQLKLPVLLNKISKRHYLTAITKSIERINKFINDNMQHIDNELVKGTDQIFYTLSKIKTRRLGEVLIFMQLKNIRQFVERELLKKVIMKCFYRKLKAPFNHWLKKIEEKLLTEGVRLRGKTVQKIAELHINRNSLLSIIHTEKLRDKLELYSNMEAAPKSNRKIKTKKQRITHIRGFNSIRKISRKSVSLTEVFNNYKKKKKEILVCKFLKVWNASTGEAALQDRFIYYWRTWVNRRKMISNKSVFVLKRLKNIEKSWALNRLRNIKQAFAKTQSSRKDLISRIIEDTRAINEMNKEATNMQNIIIENRDLCKKDAWRYIRGRKLAAGTIIRYFQRVLYKTFTKWKCRTQELEISEYIVLTEQKSEALKNLTLIKERLNTKSKELLSECGELRKSSMEGLEIASVIQNIAREREQMSVDLAGRSLIIRKLVTENEILQRQLNEISMKNEKLLKMSNN